MMWDMVIESFGSAFIAGLISWCISKSTAKAEIKKLRETWEHEKETVVNAEFDNMISAVSFLSALLPGRREKLLSKKQRYSAQKRMEN